MFFSSVSVPQQRTPERLTDIVVHHPALPERRPIRVMEAEVEMDLLLVLFVSNVILSRVIHEVYVLLQIG